MRIRPWPLVFLALFQFISPISNILFCSYLMKLHPLDYTTGLIANSTLAQLFEFFCLGPIAGVAIWKIRSWSYPVFLSITAWTIVANFESWQQYPNIIHLPVLIGAYLVNVALVGYFLFPAVRSTYFNPKLRWWETQPRYVVDQAGEIEGHWGVVPCRIANISEGGVFLMTPRELSPGEPLKLRFELLQQKIDTPARVIYARRDGHACGVQFARNAEFQSRIKKITQAMELLGFQHTLRKGPWHRELRSWFGELASGKGWVPGVDAPPDKSAPKVEKSAPEDRAA